MAPVRSASVKLACLRLASVRLASARLPPVRLANESEALRQIPKETASKPDRELLAERFEKFQKAS